jgi:hypothetical protein
MKKYIDKFTLINLMKKYSFSLERELHKYWTAFCLIGSALFYCGSISCTLFFKNYFVTYAGMQSIAIPMALLFGIQFFIIYQKQKEAYKQRLENTFFPLRYCIFTFSVYFSVQWSVLLFNGSIHCYFKRHNL